MKRVETTWEYTLETEAKRILYTGRQMAVGFYRANHFPVLPYKWPMKTPGAVYFPDLPYFRIKRFWDKVSRLDINRLPLAVEEKLLEQTIFLIKEHRLAVPKYDRIRTIWGKTQSELIKEIYRLLPGKNGAITHITIYPTLYGTVTSFNLPTTFPTQINLYLRVEQSIFTICEAILTALTRHDVYTEFNGTWSESELLVDWLVLKSPLSTILKKFQPSTLYQPTIKYTRVKQNAKNWELSEKFYRKVGLPKLATLITLHENEPLIHGKPFPQLTSREKQLLALFIKNGPQISSFDSVAEVLFSNKEEFSLYAISKAIERLRNKLENQGISGGYIQTLRGQGYILKN